MAFIEFCFHTNRGKLRAGSLISRRIKQDIIVLQNTCEVWQMLSKLIGLQNSFLFSTKEAASIYLRQPPFTSIFFVSLQQPFL